MRFSSRHPLATVKNSRFPSRRHILKGIAGLLAAGMLPSFPLTASATSHQNRILIVYFSHTGNTRTVAQQIQAVVGGDLLELKTVQPYPAAHADTVRQAKMERANQARPQLSTQFPKTMSDYDLVFVGYPVWDYTMPMALFSFFDQFTFAGKTIAPFSTHLGSGLADGPEQIAGLCPQATVREGLAIRGTEAADARETVTRWLRQLGVEAK